MINANVFYRTSNLVALKFGWTEWKISHHGDFRGERLFVKVHLAGPNIGIIFYL